MERIINIRKGVYKILFLLTLLITLSNYISAQNKYHSKSKKAIKKFEIAYKDIILPHYYIADFVAFGKIIIEVKAQENVAENHYKQVINYLAVSKLKLGLIINFGEESLKFKRVALTK